VLRAAATKSLREFVRQAFNIVVPAEPFMANWHTDAICDHLEALRRRKIRNLLITMPPRHLKSTIVSVLFPPWCWLHDPTERFLTASYAADLATRDAVASRTLIESAWFQRWPVRIDQTQNRQDRFSNTQRGYRLVTSVGGSTTGEGGDILVLDDPHNIREAESEATRTEAVLWHNRIWSTRGNNPATACRVVVCQRSHHQDVAGDILAKGGYEHLNLPMEYEASRVVLPSKICWKDPRQEEGELLHPARFSAATVANLKTTLGSYAYAAQFQQRPTPLEGGMFKRTWWRFTDASPADVIAKAELAKSKGTYVNACWSWDCTFKDLKTSDYVVGICVVQIGAQYHVIELVRGRMDFPASKRAVQLAQGRWIMPAILVEDSANGTALVADLRESVSGLISRPTRGESKESRASAVSPRVEAGNVTLCTAPWNSAFVEELAAFNLGAHDDQVDAFSQALNWLMEKERKRGGAVDRELVLKTARLMNERRQQRVTVTTIAAALIMSG
jgi:predicted phage terminase large subunit-like protein